MEFGRNRTGSAAEQPAGIYLLISRPSGTGAYRPTLRPDPRNVNGSDNASGQGRYGGYGGTGGGYESYSANPLYI
jgi:hypothetical protein